MKTYLKSKWTSIYKNNGWKHYQVKNVYKKRKQLELFAICNKDIIIIIEMDDIKDVKKWLFGWK